MSAGTLEGSLPSSKSAKNGEYGVCSIERIEEPLNDRYNTIE